MPNAQELMKMSDDALEHFRRAGDSAMTISNNQDLTQDAIIKRSKELREREIESGKKLLKEFNKGFIDRLKEMKRKELESITPNHPNDSAFFGKMQLLNSVYANKTPRELMDLYSEGLSLGDNEKIYFVEEVVFPGLEPNSKNGDLRRMIAETRKRRLPDSVKNELEELEALKRFYNRSVELVHNYDPDFAAIRYLFFSRGLRVPESSRALFK